MNSIRIRREVPVRHEVDIFVIGGGPAGVSAAVAAARQGRKVFLAEGQNCLGGMGTAGMVPAFMRFGNGTNFLAAGIGEEILTRLRESDGIWPAGLSENNNHSIGIKAEVLKRIYDEMVSGAGVEFTFHTQLIDVETNGDRVTAAIVAAKSGVFAVKAKIYIDCTGDGDLAAWAGAPFEKGDEQGNLMPGTLCSLWANVDFDTWKQSGMIASCRLPEAFKDKVFTHEDMHLPGFWQVGPNIGGGNIGHTFGVDGTDERSLTEALIWGRKSMLEYERYYKNYLKGFKDMELLATGSLLGLRETRRIMGDYVLDLDDFQARAVFDDEIGRYSYPVDIHPSRPNQADYKRFEKEFRELYRYDHGESYGIPYRTLVPQKLTNVLVAGRCISTDRYVQGSVRVMPGCYITGQAAGVAAALAVETQGDTRSINIAHLLERLKKIGAFLPNAT